MEATNNIVSVENVKKYFGDTRAVDGVSLNIKKGEFVALLGPNGAGKTTLVEMIEGIQKPDSGKILINGKPWKGHEADHHKIIGLSLQETRFIEKLTTLETLNLFASFYELPQDRIGVILDLVGLESKKKTYAKNLSGGQRQKLALGIALLNQPEILLLDEPTTGLDPTARREIWDILKRLQKEFNTAMILTTHYMEEASFLCERIIIIDHGNILAEGTLENLLSQYKKGEVIDFTIDRPISPELFPTNGTVQTLELDDARINGEIIVDNLVEYLPIFLKFIDSQGIALTSLECRKMTLDDLFISMTGRHLNE